MRPPPLARFRSASISCLLHLVASHTRLSRGLGKDRHRRPTPPRTYRRHLYSRCDRYSARLLRLGTRRRIALPLASKRSVAVHRRFRAYLGCVLLGRTDADLSAQARNSRWLGRRSERATRRTFLFRSMIIHSPSFSARLLKSRSHHRCYLRSVLRRLLRPCSALQARLG